MLGLDIHHHYQKHAIQDEHVAIPLTTNGVFQVVTLHASSTPTPG